MINIIDFLGNNNHTEMISVLSFLDLPFENPEHQYSLY